MAVALVAAVDMVAVVDGSNHRFIGGGGGDNDGWPYDFIVDLMSGDP